MAKKRAVLICEALAVLCPYCGEAQPTRKGSEMWTVEDLKIEVEKLRDQSGGSAVTRCCSCDVEFVLSVERSAKIERG